MAAGDHLLISWGGYHHHAVDMGDGTVIQYGGGQWNRGQPPQVEQVSRETWPADREIRVLEEPAEFPPEEILRRARSRLGERRYCLLTNNCEHFVHWARQGSAVSHQSESARRRLVAIAGRTACQQTARLAGRRAHLPLARWGLRGGTAWLLAADATQWIAELSARGRGLPVQQARGVGRLAGAGMSLGIGACVGGPWGAALALGSWASGEAIQASLCQRQPKRDGQAGAASLG